MTKIHLVLVDDWEIRGDGSGDMRAIQFEPLKKLLAVYEKNGLKASLSAELMQQLTHREWGEKHPELRALADDWDEIVRDVIRRGHDVQLHLHPQWLGASYADGKWTLPGDWSLTKHRPEDVRDMLRRGRDYLVDLIKPIRRDYEVVSFKAGAWALAPSDFLLDLMAEVRIRIDLSVFPGVHYDNDKVKLDYRQCEETFLPYHPDRKDARRVATEPGSVVCFPGNFWFVESRRYVFFQALRRARRDLLAKVGIATGLPKRVNEGAIEDASYSQGIWASRDVITRPPRAPRESGLKGLALWLVRPTLNWLNEQRPDKCMADISTLTGPQLADMLRFVHSRARASGRDVVPIVLENHTKDVHNLEPLEAFARRVARARDMEVITLTDLAKNLAAGVYQPVVKPRGEAVSA